VRRPELRLFAAVFLVAGVLATPFASSNENRTIVLLRALEHGRLTIDPDVALTGDRAFVPGRISAAALAVGGVVPAGLLRGGHSYAGVAPGLAFAVAPTYFLARAARLPAWGVELALVFAGAVLPLALGAVAVSRAVRAAGDPSEDALLAGATFGLATIALAYGMRLWAHALAVSLLAWALALALEIDAPTRAWKRGALAGLLAALAVTTDYNTGLVAAALLGLASARGGARGAIAFVLGGLGPALALAGYHEACFGSPFKTGYDFHAAADVRAILDEGRFGFSFPRPSILFELLLGTRRGFLFTQPVALLGLAGLVALARRGRTHAFALGVAALVLSTNAARVHDWAGGTCFGARYSMAALPFVLLGLPRGLALAGTAGPWVVAASGALAITGASVVGTTTGFPFTVASALEGLWLFGPRTLGLSVVLLGLGDHDPSGANALVALAALSFVLPLAVLLVRPTAPRGVFVALVLAPSLALSPFAARWLRQGPDSVRRSRTAFFRHEVARMLPAATHPAQVGYVLASATRARDMESIVLCYARLVELEPGDADAREMLGLAQAELARERGRSR
jgi:hypothetical protein